MNEDMQFSEAGMALMEASEGLELTAYKCPAGVWTIGYGHTGADVYEGLTIDLDKAQQLLRADIRFAEMGVKTYAKVELTQGQYDALVDFAFNLGIGALRSSTLLKKLNSGDYYGASKEFARWNQAGGKVLSGLTRRRLAEEGLFNS